MQERNKELKRGVGIRTFLLKKMLSVDNFLSRLSDDCRWKKRRR